MASAIYIGTDLSNQLVESPGSPERVKTGEKDSVTRKYKTRYGSVETLINGLGFTLPDFPSHYLTAYKYNRTGEGDFTEVVLTFETIDTVLDTNAPLPPDEIEWIVSTTERHLGGHPSYKPEWMGIPKTNGINDPRGIPTVALTDSNGHPATNNSIVAKPGVENYLIPTVVYRKVSYTHTKPAVASQSVATRNIPSGESGTNKWLKTGVNLRITKGVYQLSEEWMYLPIGTWDTDIYGTS